MRKAIVLAAIIVSGCAEYPALTPSELNARAEQYDGKEVRVRGWMVHQFENIGLWDSKAAYDGASNSSSVPFAWPTTCMSLSGLDGPRISEEVIVEGVFRKHILPPNVVSNGVCNDTGLEVARFRKQGL
jgi:hypothetical protein